VRGGQSYEAANWFAMRFLRDRSTALLAVQGVAPLGGKSKVSPRGALNLPAARFLQTKRFDPLPFPPPPIEYRMLSWEEAASNPWER
jgi:hypothetical protein